MPDDASPDRILRLRRLRRIVGVAGAVGVAASLALAVATSRRGTGAAGAGDVGGVVVRAEDRLPARPASPARRPGGEPRPVDLAGAHPGEEFAPGEASPTSSEPKGRTKRLRVRIVEDGVAVAGAVVRAVSLDPASKCAHPLSEIARTGSDGVAEVVVPLDDVQGGWIEVASADTRGMRHGYHPLAASIARADGEIEVSIPPAGRLEIEVLGLPPEQMLPYVDVRFLTPDGGWEELFSDLPATPIEDGGLFETKCIPRTERVKLRREGRGEIPNVPVDHGIYVEFPATPDGWLVDRSTFSGRSLDATTGEVLRVAAGATGVYRVTYRPMPSVLVRVEDATGRPLPGATVVAGLRLARDRGRPTVFETSSSTDERGAVTVPLWTGPRLPAWSPVGVVVVASAPGHAAGVVETDGGWYGETATLRLPDAPAGAFVVEGTLKHAGGGFASGIPVRLTTAPPWNGHAALPPLRATTDEFGGWRIEVPEGHRAVLAFGGKIRLEVDAERLETQSSQALWRARFPNLPRATMTPDEFDLPARGSSVRHDTVLDVPPP